jgi:hypothetical protein
VELRYGVITFAEEVIEAAGRTLAATASDPVKIVLFGSRARGDATPDSNFDVLVVERARPIATPRWCVSAARYAPSECRSTSSS